jgi:hypothetical protein
VSRGIRWKLELGGTSRAAVPALESTLDEIGWRRWPTEVHTRLGVTRVYIETDTGESARSILMDLIDHGLQYSLPAIARERPLKPAALKAQWEAVRAHARAHRPTPA